MSTIPLPRALGSILAVTSLSLVIAGSLLFGPHLWHQWKAYHTSCELRYVVQKPVGYNTLPTSLLIERMNLAIDAPLNLYQCDLQTLAANLAALPVFASLALTKHPPHTLIVHYALRTPIAHLANYSHTAVDSEGVLFPLYPYYSPQELPHIVVASTFNPSLLPWGQRLPASTAAHLKTLLPLLTNFFASFPSTQWTLDLSDTYLSPQHEITLRLENSGQRPCCLLRLTLADIDNQLRRFAQLHKQPHTLPYPQNASLIVDLRCPDTTLVALFNEP